jgi:hypothetical protein
LASSLGVPLIDFAVGGATSGIGHRVIYGLGRSQRCSCRRFGGDRSSKY